MNNLEEVLEGVRTVGIGGHVRPDGDCVGSCTAVYLYLKKWFPQIQTDLYLESRRDVFSYLAGFDEIRTEPDTSGKGLLHRVIGVSGKKAADVRQIFAADVSRCKLRREQ